MKKLIRILYIVTTVLVMISPLAAQSTSNIIIESNISGAKVYLDGKYAGDTREQLGRIMAAIRDVPLGRHSVSISAEGFQDKTYTFSLTAETYTVTHNFVQASIRETDLNETSRSQSRNQTGSIIVRSLPPKIGVILNNGIRRGETDKQWDDCPIGNQTLVFRADDEHVLSGSFYLGENQTVTVTADFLSFPPVLIIDVDYRLILKTNEPDVSVAVDGKPVGRTPLTIDLQHGTHSIRLEKPGYETITETVSLDRDRMLEYFLTPIVHKVNFVTEPAGGRLYVDSGRGKNYIGVSPVTLELVEGDYTVSAEKPGWITYKSQPLDFSVGISDTNNTLTVPMDAPIAELTYQRENGVQLSGLAKINGSSIGALSGRIWKVEVPAGRVEFEAAGLKVNAQLSDGHSYSFTPLPPYEAPPIASRYREASQVPGYREYPPKPSPLSATQTVIGTEKVLVPNYESDFAIGGGVVGFIAGFAAPIIIAPPVDSNIDTSVFFGWVAAGVGGSLVGVLVGAFIGGDEVYQKHTEKITDYEKKNEIMLAEWEKQKEEIDSYNLDLLIRKNQEIDEENRKLQNSFAQQNRNRGVIILTDLNTGAKSILTAQ